MNEMDSPGTFSIYVTFDADKVSPEEVRATLLANAASIGETISTSLLPLTEQYQTTFQIQIGGLPQGTIQFPPAD